VRWSPVRSGWFVRSVGGLGDGRLEALALSEAGRRTLENWAKRRGTRAGTGAAGADRLGLRGRRAQHRGRGAADAGGQQPVRSADEVCAAASGQVRRCVCTELDARLLTGALPRAALDSGVRCRILVLWI